MKIVPILVGAVSAENEAMYGQILAQFVDDPTNFFSISSDFCHWGSRYVLFSYMLNYLISFFLFSVYSCNLQLLSEMLKKHNNTQSKHLETSYVFYGLFT